jgi:carboxylate-amine ligase
VGAIPLFTRRRFGEIGTGHPGEAMAKQEAPNFGIEEEFLLGDAETGEIREDGEAVFRRAREIVGEGVDHELRAAMVETGTAVCRDIGSALRDVQAHRRAAVTAAGETGARVLATGSHPTARAAQVGFGDEHRYQRMASRFGRLADEALVCGCHVHVQVPSRDIGVDVIDRIRVWLAPIAALAANSPLWQGQDTDYDSWRMQVWSRFPTAGPTSSFDGLDNYEARADALIASGAALDRAMLYYDARLSEKYPTVEVRVADVCLEAADAVCIAALVRALVVQAIGSLDRPAPDAPVELLRAAAFMASRWGVRAELVDPQDWRAKPAAVVLNQLLAHVRTALEATGDESFAAAHVARLLAGETGAARQRRAWRAGGPEPVLDLVGLA